MGAELSFSYPIYGFGEFFSGNRIAKETGTGKDAAGAVSLYQGGHNPNFLSEWAGIRNFHGGK